MATPIKQIQTIDNTVHDLDNRCVVLSTTSGTLTAAQLAVLQESNQNYIEYVSDGTSFYFRFVADNGTILTYHRFAHAANKTQVFSITKSTGAYTYGETELSTSDTKNTTGSGQDGSNKLYIVGARTQSSTGPVTYSNSDVYEQSGSLYANQLTVTADPTSNLQVATKQYVDNAIGAAIAASY